MDSRRRSGAKGTMTDSERPFAERLTLWTIGVVLGGSTYLIATEAASIAQPLYTPNVVGAWGGWRFEIASRSVALVLLAGVALPLKWRGHADIAWSTIASGVAFIFTCASGWL